MKNLRRAFDFLLGAAIVAVSLTACAPRLMATGDAVYPPRLVARSGVEMASAVMSDGAHLPMRVWAAEKPHAVVIGVHGMNDYSNAFAMPGPWFAAHGMTLVAYDQRGFGEAPGHGLWAGAARMASDLDTIVELTHKKYPGVPVYLLGTSMGGAVTMRAFNSATPPKVDGVILASPAVWGWRAMNAFYETVLWMSAHLLPSLTLSGSGLGIQPSDNIPMLRALGKDPLVIKETEIGTIYGLVELMDEAALSASHINVPVLLMYGAHDEIVPPVPMGQALEDMRNAHVDVTAACYPKGYHMLLRDLDREVVWRDIESWIEARGKPLPSGAENLAPCPTLAHAGEL